MLFFIWLWTLLLLALSLDLPQPVTAKASLDLPLSGPGHPEHASRQTQRVCFDLPVAVAHVLGKQQQASCPGCEAPDAAFTFRELQIVRAFTGGPLTTVSADKLSVREPAKEHCDSPAAQADGQHKDSRAASQQRVPPNQQSPDGKNAGLLKSGRERQIDLLQTVWIVLLTSLPSGLCVAIVGHFSRREGGIFNVTFLDEIFSGPLASLMVIIAAVCCKPVFVAILVLMCFERENVSPI